MSVLTRSELQKLAQALASGALAAPFTTTAVAKHVRNEVAESVCGALEALAGKPPAEAMATWLELLADERRSVQMAHDEVEFIWTGPEGTGSVARDTWVAVTELFRSAEHEIVLASYALHDGREVLKELADRVRQRPQLKVRMYLHIHRDWDDVTASESELLVRFAKDFREKHWPKDVPLPSVFYDPRTVAKDPKQRASLHAKVIVVDGARVLLTSANLTEAAQRRNIEAGLLVENALLAKAVVEQFDALVARGIARQVPGLV